MGWLADLLEQIPSAAAYKIQLEKLDSEYKILKAEHERVKSENNDLSAKLEAAHNEIDRLKEEAQAKLVHRSDRPEIQRRILILLTTQTEMTTERIAALTRQGREAAKFHLDELFTANCVTRSTNQAFESVWSLGHEGRRYLIDRGLLR
jgi:chromosome segregation ATPase